MDGTIVCSLHRYRTIIDGAKERIDLDHWRANEHRALDDSLRPLHSQYLQDLADPACYVIIATARVMGAADWLFIEEKLGSPDYFISRKPGDTQSGKTLKIGGLTKFFNLPQFRNIPAVFYEDNMDYLKAVCDRFNISGVYTPSKQGH